MNTEQHREKFANLRNLATASFEIQGSHAPQIIRMRENGGDDILCLPHTQQDQIEKIIVGLISEGCESLCYIAEAWTLREEHVDTADQHDSIEQNPNRVEILSAIYTTPKGDFIATAEIVRPQEQTPILNDWVVYDEEYSTDYGGQFSHFWERANAEKN
jgi:hypothetical protein